jgi:hypothetical protein
MGSACLFGRGSRWQPTAPLTSSGRGRAPRRLAPGWMLTTRMQPWVDKLATVACRDGKLGSREGLVNRDHLLRTLVRLPDAGCYRSTDYSPSTSGGSSSVATCPHLCSTKPEVRVQWDRCCTVREIQLCSSRWLLASMREREPNRGAGRHGLVRPPTSGE